MKINKATIRNFKRFKEETFDLGGNVVLAGPNNSGKTTLLQAIATWSLALERWRELNDYRLYNHVYAKAPIARQAFYSVPLRAFDLLWNERTLDSGIEIELILDGKPASMEVNHDSTEQVYVRPRKDVDREWLQNLDHSRKFVFVPAMSGLSIEEPVYRQPKIEQLLGQGKPGDVLRNLLVETHHNQDAWEKLVNSIGNMFDYQLLPPNAEGPNIIAEYQHSQRQKAAKFDIASAGSGFLQVLMLLTFLHSRQGTVLLLDEPDAHLHVILQDRIYSELRVAAQASNSQLIIATHSEVVINAVDPRELCALLDKPRKIANDEEKASLIQSLSILSNMDIMLATDQRKILYVEGHTDLNMLRAWAKILNHPITKFMEQPFWKPTVSEPRLKGKGMKAKDHFESLLLVQVDIRGVEISDRDGNERTPENKMAMDGKLLKLCWARYEIESYLIQPVALARFVGKIVGSDAPQANIDAMKEIMKKHLPGAVVDGASNNHSYLLETKAKTILSAILEDTGLHGFPANRYFEIAAVMQPDEVHPEITQKLDAIADHFSL